MGRRKIAIKLIKQETDRQQTFGKRKIGLLKKAMELSILCDCEIALTVRPRRGNTQTQLVYASDPYNEIMRNFQKYRGDYILYSNADVKDLIPGKQSSHNAGDHLFKRHDDIEADSARKHSMAQFMSTPMMTQPQIQCLSMSNMPMMPSRALDELLNPLFDALPSITDIEIPPQVLHSESRKRSVEEMMDGDGDEAMGIGAASHSEEPPTKKLKPNVVAVQRMDELCKESMQKEGIQCTSE